MLTFLMMVCQDAWTQRAVRLTDSLTLDSTRSWIYEDGSAFTQLGDDCDRGMEMTFYEEDRKVDIYRCHEGEWKVSAYTFEVTTEMGEHHLELFQNVFFWRRKVSDLAIEVQMVADSTNRLRTELYVFQLDSKRTFRLSSK